MNIILNEKDDYDMGLDFLKSPVQQQQREQQPPQEKRQQQQQQLHLQQQQQQQQQQQLQQQKQQQQEQKQKQKEEQQKQQRQKQYLRLESPNKQQPHQYEEDKENIQHHKEKWDELRENVHKTRSIKHSFPRSDGVQVITPSAKLDDSFAAAPAASTPRASPSRIPAPVASMAAINGKRNVASQVSSFQRPQSDVGDMLDNPSGSNESIRLLQQEIQAQDLKIRALEDQVQEQAGQLRADRHEIEVQRRTIEDQKIQLASAAVERQDIIDEFQMNQRKLTNEYYDKIGKMERKYESEIQRLKEQEQLDLDDAKVEELQEELETAFFRASRFKDALKTSFKRYRMLKHDMELLHQKYDGLRSSYRFLSMSKGVSVKHEDIDAPLLSPDHDTEYSLEIPSTDFLLNQGEEEENETDTTALCHPDNPQSRVQQPSEIEDTTALMLSQLETDVISTAPPAKSHAKPKLKPYILMVIFLIRATKAATRARAQKIEFEEMHYEQSGVQMEEVNKMVRTIERNIENQTS
ncbi:uncharacterized protein J8A68_000405 [[Candida] subhashii]|uniref:Uncharacterized protein n=1 Tax=[Candida] subhashii TaxID=561895 RepID=A0A8J5QJP2_9ASCO|nr:uncharacterized protein J8A68_000405 [[Candida] subhashii]KAG7665976.1 hypothetical protein J8A68_000405 [[Candida] subhashii]